MSALRSIALIAASSCFAPTALAQPPQPPIAPDTAARTVEPTNDEPPASGERRAEADLDSYLDGRIEEDRASLGQVPPGAERLQAALEEAFAPSHEGIDLQHLEHLPRLVLEELTRQALPPTDAESRDPSLPPPISQEDEIVANRVAGLDPRRARSFTTAVELELELDARGRVFRSHVTRSSGRSELDQQARDAPRSLRGRSFGTRLARHTVIVRLELVERLTRWNALTGSFDLDHAPQLGVLGRGISWGRVRVVRARPPAP